MPDHSSRTPPEAAPPRPARRDRTGFAPVRRALPVAVLLLGWLLLTAGPFRPTVEVALYGCGVLAVRRGVEQYRPVATAAWIALAAALGLFAASSAAEVVELTGLAVPVAARAESVLDLFGYAGLAAAGLAVLTSGGQWRTRDAWLDVVTLVLAAALTGAAWTTGVDQLPAGPAAGERPVGLALLTAVLLISGVRLGWPGTSRSPSGLALCTAGLLAVTGYAAALLDLPPDVSRLPDALSLSAVAAVSYAAGHPSMTGAGAPARGGRTTPVHMVGLGAALLVNPAVVLIWTLRHDGGPLLAAGVAALTLLALWRIARLTSERERAGQALLDSQARLRHQATTDALTGLANRPALLDHLTGALTSREQHDPAALLFVDLDGFKAVNDTLGHTAGDELLTTVADRLRGCVRGHHDVVARLGGDEFALLLLGASPSDAADVAGRALTALRQPVTVGGLPVLISGSVGIAHVAPDSTPASLLHHADAAMYTAKRRGKNRYHLHTTTSGSPAMPFSGGAEQAPTSVLKVQRP